LELEANTQAWYLRVGEEKFPALNVNEVFKRFYSENKVRMVSENADRSAHDEMEQLAFHRGGIAPGTAREGLLFFRMKPALAANWVGTATLCAFDIQLAPRSRTRIEIVLSHAKS
jgi:hypothetical protein